MTRSKIANLWNTIFAKQITSTHPAAPATSWPPIAGRSPSAWFTSDSSMSAGPEQLSPLRELDPASSNFDTTLADAPEWYKALQVHVSAVHANDTAVRLFRAGQLEAAIAQLRRGLEANRYYATGYSNLGFLYLRQAKLEQAIECLLRALEVDPAHHDAPDHLCDVLLALTDELAQIGLRAGFLATQPGVKFDAYNRHRRARDIGILIAKIGRSEVLKVDGQALGVNLLMELVIHAVQKKMDRPSALSSLRFTWRGIDGWNPPVAIRLRPSTQGTDRHLGRGSL